MEIQFIDVLVAGPSKAHFEALRKLSAMENVGVLPSPAFQPPPEGDIIMKKGTAEKQKIVKEIGKWEKKWKKAVGVIAKARITKKIESLTNQLDMSFG